MSQSSHDYNYTNDFLPKHNMSLHETEENGSGRVKKIRNAALLIAAILLSLIIVYRENQKRIQQNLIASAAHNAALSIDSAVQSTVSALQSTASTAYQNTASAVLDYYAAQAVTQKTQEAEEQILISRPLTDQWAESYNSSNSSAMIQRPVLPQVGSTLYFGHYEQDNRASNGKEPIEWIVLDIKGNQALLLSRYGLDALPYNSANTNVTWSVSTLRNWLNKTFFNTAFNGSEQSMILTTQVDNSGRQGNSEWYNTTGGNNTNDKIFLLSYMEAGLYFRSDSSRRMAATAYAKAQGAYADPNGYSWWWLRSPGRYQSTAAHVHFDGVRIRCSVSDLDVCIRPAMWINIY